MPFSDLKSQNSKECFFYKSSFLSGNIVCVKIFSRSDLIHRSYSIFHEEKIRAEESSYSFRFYILSFVTIFHFSYQILHFNQFLKIKRFYFIVLLRYLPYKARKMTLKSFFADFRDTRYGVTNTSFLCHLFMEFIYSGKRPRREPARRA